MFLSIRYQIKQQKTPILKKNKELLRLNQIFCEIKLQNMDTVQNKINIMNGLFIR